jgi:hypothetical protein
MITISRVFSRWLLTGFSPILAGLAAAETVSFSGSANVSVQEFVNGSPGSSASDTKSFPDPDGTLPLQVVSVVRSGTGSFPSAAAAAAQFADPTTQSGDNPEEFAINLTLNSVDPAIRYEATAESQERREILFSAGEVSAGSLDGDEETLIGRLFIDGALTIIAVASDRDLSGAAVTLSATVVKSGSGQSDETVYFGQIELRGQPDGQVVVASDGAFPTNRLILTDLSAINGDFAAFRVLIIPRIEVDFEYKAIVGQPLTLTATIAVDAANAPDNVGVAAVIGTPTDTLTDVIGFTSGTASAAKLVDNLRGERDDPTGEPAFESSEPAPLFPFCGLFGFEGLIGLVGIIALGRRIRS